MMAVCPQGERAYGRLLFNDRWGKSDGNEGIAIFGRRARTPRAREAAARMVSAANWIAGVAAGYG